MNSAAQRKTVYVNHRPIGEAFCWADVNAMLATKRILFTAKPTKSEGPRGFYIDGMTAEDEARIRHANRRDIGDASQPKESAHSASITEIAELLIASYGERAANHAALQAAKARNHGEARLMEAWEWIANAVFRAMRAGEG